MLNELSDYPTKNHGGKNGGRLERMVPLIRCAGKVKLIERSNSRVERRFWQGEWFLRQAARGIAIGGESPDCFVRVDGLGRDCAVIR